MRKRTLYGKYNISKADGTPIDPDAQYFILRLDTDKHARVAIDAYAESLMEEFRRSPELLKENAQLSMDIYDWLSDIVSNEYWKRQAETQQKSPNPLGNHVTIRKSRGEKISVGKATGKRNKVLKTTIKGGQK